MGLRISELADDMQLSVSIPAVQEGDVRWLWLHTIHSRHSRFLCSVAVLIPSEWVEKSWEDGFPGAEYFKGKLASTKGKMGTNDVAALFRFFGVK